MYVSKSGKSTCDFDKTLELVCRLITDVYNVYNIFYDMGRRPPFVFLSTYGAPIRNEGSEGRIFLQEEEGTFTMLIYFI